MRLTLLALLAISLTACGSSGGKSSRNSTSPLVAKIVHVFDSHDYAQAKIEYDLPGDLFYRMSLTPNPSLKLSDIPSGTYEYFGTIHHISLDNGFKIDGRFGIEMNWDDKSGDMNATINGYSYTGINFNFDQGTGIFEFSDKIQSEAASPFETPHLKMEGSFLGSGATSVFGRYRYYPYYIAASEETAIGVFFGERQ